MPDNLGETKKSALWLSAQMATASVVGMVVGFPIRVTIASILGPAGYGTVKVAELIQRYFAYADLGMKHSLSRQVPLLLGKGEDEECRQVSAIVLTWFLIVSTVAVVVLWLFYTFDFSLKGLLTLPNLSVICLILLSDRLNTYFHNYVKGYGLFGALGTNAFISSVLSPFIILPLVLWMNVTGALVGRLVVSLLIGINFLRYILPHGALQTRLTLPWAKTLSLLKLSILLYSNNLSEGLLAALSLTLLAFFVVVDELGYFGYAVTIVLTATGITTGVNIVIYRRMLEARGALGLRTGYFRRYLETSMVVYVFFVSIALGFTYFAHHVVIRLFLPQFAPSLVLAQILAVGQMALSIIYLLSLYFNVTDQLGRRLAFACSSVLLTFVLNLVVLWLGYGAIGVAFCTTLSYFVYATLLMQSRAHQIYGRLATGIAILAKLLSASMLLGLSLHLLTLWQPEWPTAPNQLFSWAFELMVTSMRFGIYAAVTCFLYAALFRRYRPERDVFTILRYLALSLWRY